MQLQKTDVSIPLMIHIKSCNTFYSIIHFTFYCLDAPFTASIAQLVECLLSERSCVRGLTIPRCKKSFADARIKGVVLGR